MRAAWLVCLLAHALAPSLARAQAAAGADRPALHVRVDPCVGAEDDEVARVVGVELGVLPAPWSERATTQVEVACDGAVLLRLRLDDGLTGKSLERAIDAAAIAPAVRSRVIGIAIAELVRASWAELVVTPAPVVPPAGARPRAAERAAAAGLVRSQTPRRHAARPARLALRVGGLATVRAFSSGLGPAWGGGLRVAGETPRVVGWAADLVFEHADARATLGAIAVDSVTLGASVLAHATLGGVSLRVGPGLRAGVGRMTGASPSVAVTSGTFVAPWGGPDIVGGASVVLARTLVIEAFAEAGLVAFGMGALVAGAREVAIEGVWIAAGVHVGIAL